MTQPQQIYLDRPPIYKRANHLIRQSAGDWPAPFYRSSRIGQRLVVFTRGRYGAGQIGNSVAWVQLPPRNVS